MALRCSFATFTPNTADALQARGIYTALDLKQADQNWIRKRFSVITLRTVLELGGMSCLPVQNTSDPKQGVMVSRCFGRPVTEFQEMKEALNSYPSIPGIITSSNSKSGRVEYILSCAALAETATSTTYPFASRNEMLSEIGRYLLCRPQLGCDDRLEVGA